MLPTALDRPSELLSSNVSLASTGVDVDLSLVDVILGDREGALRASSEYRVVEKNYHLMVFELLPKLRIDFLLLPHHKVLVALLSGLPHIVGVYDLL